MCQESENAPLPSELSCSCHINPPCSHCVAGGYCKEHDCMREECGCDSDET